MLPNFWQLLPGEQGATVIIHEMAEKIDAGGIIPARAFPLQERDSLDRVIVGTKQEGARLMIEVLNSISNESQVTATPLDMSNASYFSFPTPKDVRKLRKRGHTML
ncbi:hypothetical protein H8D99_01250 [bacterium]|nr:hypothetical protein [bacterium]